MHIAMFYHSLLSDWNHGNAHFLRGVASELLHRGHQVSIHEPHHGWSLQNLLREQGRQPLLDFHNAYPLLNSSFYNPKRLNLDDMLAGVDVVIVHEWSDPVLVRRLGEHRHRTGTYRLLFHDTHHRSVTDPESIAAYDLEHFDGVLAYGRMIRDLYLDNGWAARAWTWHEAADVHVFRPRRAAGPIQDLVWIGNWGDGERTHELYEFLLQPVRKLALRASAYGVRYSRAGRTAVKAAGIHFGGWLPNFHIPQVFAQHRSTIHIPRRPYREQLSGIPTIRVFEALACGIPLVTLPWDDTEGLFEPGEDYLVAHTQDEMCDCLSEVLQHESLRRRLAQHGRKTIVQRHTCAHRVDELLRICKALGAGRRRRRIAVSVSA